VLSLSCGTRDLSLQCTDSKVHRLSSCSAQALLPCGLWDLGSPTRDWTNVLCIAKWILNHWTTREVPYRPFLSLEKCLFNSFAHILIILTTILNLVRIRKSDMNLQRTGCPTQDSSSTCITGQWWHLCPLSSQATPARRLAEARSWLQWKDDRLFVIYTLRLGGKKTTTRF